MWWIWSCCFGTDQERNNPFTTELLRYKYVPLIEGTGSYWKCSEVCDQISMEALLTLLSRMLTHHSKKLQECQLKRIKMYFIKYMYNVICYMSNFVCVIYISKLVLLTKWQSLLLFGNCWQYFIRTLKEGNTFT